MEPKANHMCPICHTYTPNTCQYHRQNWTILQQKLKCAGVQDHTTHQWFSPSQSESEVEVKLKKLIEERNRSDTLLTGYELDNDEKKPWLVTPRMSSGKCRQHKRKCRPVSRKKQRRKPKRKSRRHHFSKRAREVLIVWKLHVVERKYITY